MAVEQRINYEQRGEIPRSAERCELAKKASEQGTRN